MVDVLRKLVVWLDRGCESTGQGAVRRNLGVHGSCHLVIYEVRKYFGMSKTAKSYGI